LGGIEMAKLTEEMAEKSGIDVEQLVDALKKYPNMKR
jgi:hypothetical protein